MYYNMDYGLSYGGGMPISSRDYVKAPGLGFAQGEDKVSIGCGGCAFRAGAPKLDSNVQESMDED